MEVILHIPDKVAERIASQGGDVSRLVLEALALEGYRERTLSLYEIAEMLGLSRVEAEDFLGAHQVELSKIVEEDLDREATLFKSSADRQAR
jgi:predicted HTH domain antitoxin